MFEKNKEYKKKLLFAKTQKRDRIHSFHRYFGKLIPAIPKFAIEEFTSPDDLVCDITCGSGTSLVEAKLAGRNSYGIDINPLAVLISKVKITQIDENALEQGKQRLMLDVKQDKGKNISKDIPFCINMDHWFKPFVQRDLVVLKRNIDVIEEKDLKDFFTICFSAFLKSVSNADPRHIFPGYSKRMHKEDENGRKINVMEAFEKLVDSRIKYLTNFSAVASPEVFSKALLADARSIPKKIKNVNLIITNPPYISSIRYLETIKLEMFWLEYLSNPEGYHNLDKTLIGTERFSTQEIQQYMNNGIKDVDLITEKLFINDQKKMSRVVRDYFVDMENIFEGMNRILDKDGRIVIKISDSHVRGFTIPTHQVFAEIASNNGLELEASFKDQIMSRSLMTKRNTYSGMLSYDWIMVFKK